MATIDINDNATPAIKELIAKAKPERLNQVVGRAGVNCTRNRLRAWNDTHPNQLGGKRTNFGAAAARSTSFEVRADGPVIGIGKVGVRQRFQGGFIRPVKAKYISVPACAEAHGKTPREFSNLRFGFAENKWGNLMPALLKAEATLIKKRKKGYAPTGSVGGEVMFWLTKRVYQPADPSILPTQEELGAYIIDGLTVWFTPPPAPPANN